MQFFKDGDYYKVVRITGPAHNLLGLSLNEHRAVSFVRVESLPTRKDEPSRLSTDEVRNAVCEGVKRANAACGTTFHVRRIQFLPSDSPPAKIYEDLAETIVRRLVAGESFSPVIPPCKPGL